MNQHLKGLSRLRRAHLGPRSQLIPFENFEVYDKWGEKRSEYVACLRETVDPFESLTLLGSGNWSMVYALDDERVIKVARTDTGYRRFAGFAALNAGNPHLPVIHYAGVWGDKDIYVLERLQEANDELARKFCEALRHILNPFLSITSPALSQIARMMTDENLCNDLCARNVMQRADGTIVITDPYYEGC